MEKLDEAPLMLYVINSENAIEVISDSKELSSMYQEISKTARSLKILFIFSAVEDIAAGFNSPAFLKQLRENRKAILLSKLSEVKLFDIPMQIQREMKAYNFGDVYLINGNDIQRMKIIEEANGHVDICALQVIISGTEELCLIRFH